MEAWIVNDCDAYTERLVATFSRLEIDCPATRILPAAALRYAGTVPAQNGDLVFFAIDTVSVDHIELLRRVASQSAAELAVVSSIPDHATVLRVIRAGAEDFLNVDGNLDEDVSGWVARVATQNTRHASKGQLISIVPCHVASDASILAVNISAVLASLAGSCCLLDFHLRGGDLALLLKLAPRHTLLDLIKQYQSFDEVMFQQALTQHSSGIRLLAGPELFADLSNIQPQTCQEILRAAVLTHPFVVVDTEDIQHSEQVHALASSDKIVLTIRKDVVSLHRAQRHVDFLTRNSIPIHHVHVVAMGTGHEGEVPTAAITKLLRIPVVHCIPADPATTTISINVGNPMVLESPKSKASKAIQQFATYLVGSLQSDDSHESSSPLANARAAAMVLLNALPYCK